MASLARIVLADRRARPRYADKAEDIAEIIGRRPGKRGRGGGAKGKTLTRAYRRDLTRDPERSSRPANAWRILEGVRGTQIDDPGARFEKKGGYRERVGGEVSVQVDKKKSTEVKPIAFFLSRARQCAWIRAYSRVCVGGPRSRACVSTEDGGGGDEGAGSSRRDVQRERAVVSLEIIINIGE